MPTSRTALRSAVVGAVFVTMTAITGASAYAESTAPTQPQPHPAAKSIDCNPANFNLATCLLSGSSSLSAK
ncbi:hypothetical protein [Nocardia suismassiliense]|uniref:hypothetical protein n=1 Tax=Nocardia suismassiliense TaxID=2077092 RepID=UPI000D1EA485|nr:hypothetical protein [Nocardia suismassiliense]